MVEGKMIKRIEFPSLRQSYNYSCGASVTQALMFYYGKDFREKELINDLNTGRKGTTLKNLTKFFKGRGFKVKQGEGYTAEDIKGYIKRDIPVILVLQAWPEKEEKDWEEEYSNGHYVVAVGYTDKGFLFSDPSSLYMTFLTYEKLEKRWHDKDGDKKYEHYVLIPYGKPPKYEKDKIIVMGSISGEIRKLANRFLNILLIWNY